MHNPAKHCLFCGIVAGQVPAARVYEDDQVMAFLDVNPIANGHTLVVPKKHMRNIFDLDPESAPGLLRGVACVARGLREALGADGMNIVQSNELAGGQTVFHLHFHLLPRFYEDNVLTIAGGVRQLNWKVMGHFQAADLEPVAERIRQALPRER